MAEERWQSARLIPTSGINGPEEAERRATSALLAVMGVVREFGQAITRPLGAPGAGLGTYIEVPFVLGERTVYPDGLLEATRAGRTWTCLVEVKTGSSTLERPQVECYLDVAREHGFDAVLTISNELAPAPGIHPVDVDKRKVRKVALHHLSWAEVLTVAVQQRVHRGVDDPEQAWILGELIRYLEHPKSGALDFSDMGSAWVEVREAVATGTLRANDKGLAEVISRWEQLLRFAALRLGRELGADVQVQLSRRELAEPSIRFAAQTQSLVSSGVLSGSIRIPDAIGALDVTADVRAGRVTVSVDVDAPRDGRAATRVNWLTRQLKDAPENLRIDAFALQQRTSTSDLLRAVRENPQVLIADSKRELRTFRVAATSPLGSKRGVGRGAFIDSVLASIDGFYEVVLQQLRPWVAKAPQLPTGGRTAAEEAGIEVSPPPLDLREPAEPEVTTYPPDEIHAQDQLSEAVASVTNEDTGDLEVDASVAPTSEPEYVSWERAQERLDHERNEDPPPVEFSGAEAAQSPNSTAGHLVV
jgi:hypothetical protein